MKAEIPAVGRHACDNVMVLPGRVYAWCSTCGALFKADPAKKHLEKYEPSMIRQMLQA